MEHGLKLVNDSNILWKLFWWQKIFCNKNDKLFEIHLNVSGPPKLKEIKIERHFGKDKLIQLFTGFSGNVSYG